MELNGYYFDKERNRYFKKSSLSKNNFSSMSNTLNDYNLENKFKNSLVALNNIQLNGLKNQKSYSMFSSFDSILASRFSSNEFKYRTNSKIETCPSSSKSINPYCSYLTSLPEKNLVFGVWTDTEKSYVLGLNFKNALKPDFNSLETGQSIILSLKSKDFSVNQIIPMCIKNSIYLFKLESNSNLKTKLYSYNFNYENNEDDFFNSRYKLYKTSLNDFSSSFDIKDNKAVFGGENFVYIYEFSNSLISFEKLIRIRLAKSSLVNAIKIDDYNRNAFCGLSNGFLDVIDLVNNQKTQSYKLGRNKIVDLQILDDNSLILSAHNHNLFQIDLRYYKENEYLMKFEKHVNNCKNIKFYIDDVFNTITCCGQDKTLRIWSINSGRLIRNIPFIEICDTLKNNKFDKTPLLSETSNQLFNYNQTDINYKKVNLMNKNMQNNQYMSENNNLYQVVSSSKWNFLKKQPKTLTIGSITNSLDFFY